MTEINLLINPYLGKCISVRRLDHKTVKAYRCDLEQFVRWMAAGDGSFDRATIIMYIEQLNKKFAPNTVKRKIASLKAFAAYCEEEGYCSENPFRLLRMSIREPKALPRIISLEKMNMIFRAAYETDGNPEGVYCNFLVLRNRAILELMIATGLRVSEVCKINKNDLELGGRYICVAGKRAKERIVQIENENTLLALNSYLEARSLWSEYETSKGCKIDAAAVFCNRFGKRISEQSIRSMVAKVTSLAGIEDRITPHMFRHTFATMLLEKDTDIRYIQRILGHSSITTTAIYTHVASSKLRYILKNNNPRNAIVY